MSTSTLNANIASLNEISIYPNPTSNITQIESSKYYKKFEVYSSLGKLVMSGNECTIDLSRLPSSIYYIKIYFNDNYTVKKIFKQWKVKM